MKVKELLNNLTGQFTNFEIYKADNLETMSMSYNSKLIYDSSIGYEEGVTLCNETTALEFKCSDWCVVDNDEYNKLLCVACGDIDFRNSTDRTLVIITEQTLERIEG